MALLSGGGYAEYATVHFGSVMKLPEEVSFRDASAIPETWLTAFQLMYTVASTKKGDFVLIHAGASGVGTAAIQLCKLVGAIPIVTAGSTAKLEYCRSLGAAAAFNYKDEESFAEKVLEFTGGKGANVILCPVGASHAPKNLECAAPESTYVLFGLMSGAAVDKFNLLHILRKHITLVGSTLRKRPIAYKQKLVEDFAKQAIPLFGTELNPVIDSEFALENIIDAHTRMHANENKGKIIIRVSDE
jgi:tumor protein p53-inducible protein 3